MSRALSRLGTCGVCKKVFAKYTCPGCETTSCSLECSKKHKSEKSCDGIRRRTGFVRLNNLDTLHLTSDYRLIEDITRKVDICKRGQDTNSSRFHEQLSAHLHRLKQAALARQSHLLLLPSKFSKRKYNTSMYDYKLKKIFWKLELTFLNAERYKIFEARCPEDTILRTIVEKYLLGTGDVSTKVKKKLAAYTHAGIDALVVLLGAEQVKRRNKKFYKLDLKLTLQENLLGKTIVEHPQLYVCIDEFITTKPAPRECAADQPENLDVKKKSNKSLLMASSDDDDEGGTGVLDEEENFLDTSSSSSSFASEDDDDDRTMDLEVAVPTYGDLIKF